MLWRQSARCCWCCKRREFFCGFEFASAMESTLGRMLGRSLQPFGQALLSTFHSCFLQVQRRHKHTTALQNAVLGVIPPSSNITFNSHPAYPLSPVLQKVILYAWPFRMKTSSDTSQPQRFARHTRSFLEGSAAPTSPFFLMVRGKDCTVTTSPWPLTCR